MNRALVDRIASTILYEGYVLYPYRPSIKNQQRWTFGGLLPRALSDSFAGSDSASMQIECLIRGTLEATVHVTLRFLQVIERSIGRHASPPSAAGDWGDPDWKTVPELRIGETLHQPWQEAAEREVSPAAAVLGALTRQPVSHRFSLPAERTVEPLADADGTIVGALIREKESLAGCVRISAQPLGRDLFRVRVGIENETPLEAGPASRRDAMRHAFVSTHCLLHAPGAEFVSLMAPPEEFREAADKCRNIGAWPVLVGHEGDRDAMLAAPIILYDYPQIAPESPGDLFDGTEIDEILSLRIATLTDDEKRTMSQIDTRTADLLRRTESLAREELLGLHGAMRTAPSAEGA